ncbi:hypothetical protein [Pseudonocardia sp.]|uniref:hypothetical protein n=1 Tax=Pseudonocardia sp. TaxID=60912 RepID=UPI0031FD53E2
MQAGHARDGAAAAGEFEDGHPAEAVADCGQPAVDQRMRSEDLDPGSARSDPEVPGVTGSLGDAPPAQPGAGETTSELRQGVIPPGGRTPIGRARCPAAAGPAGPGSPAPPRW